MSAVRDVGQVTAEIVASSPAGAYRRVVLAVPAGAAVAETARPGHFVALSVGGPTSGTLLRRSFSIHNVTPAGAGSRGLVELIVAGHGPGTQWLVAAPPGTTVDLVGPLGRPFPLPSEPVACVLVGGGYGSAPLFWLGDVLRARGCHVEIVLGAATAERLYGESIAGRHADGVTVTTDDGSAGVRGWVSDVLPDTITLSQAQVVYACGPMGMLRSVTEVATSRGAVAQVAVEEAMACGIGICMTCVMPVIGSDGITRMSRSCLDGPVLRGDRVRWDAFSDGRCVVPEDAYGAPVASGSARAH